MLRFTKVKNENRVSLIYLMISEAAQVQLCFNCKYELAGGGVEKENQTV